jgi:putative membrane protein
MMGGYGFGTGMMLLSSLTTLLFLGGLAALMVWAITRFTGPRQPAAEDPMTILRRRLAAGELTQEQYEQARKALQG